MSDIKELLQSMKAEKDALLVEREKGATGDASILQEFNFRRLNREMNLLCNEYETLVSTNATIEEKLAHLETNPPRFVDILNRSNDKDKFILITVVTTVYPQLVKDLFKGLNTHKELGSFLDQK